MRTKANATFEIKSWDERPWDVREGLPKLTLASVRKSYRGDIDGEGVVEYVMAYREDGSASYVGLERIVGRIGRRSGSFVMQGIGKYEGGVAALDLTVVPGSGTGELRGISGKSNWSAGHGKEYPFSLEYELE